MAMTLLSELSTLGLCLAVWYRQVNPTSWIAYQGNAAIWEASTVRQLLAGERLPKDGGELMRPTKAMLGIFVGDVNHPGEDSKHEQKKARHNEDANAPANLQPR